MKEEQRFVTVDNRKTFSVLRWVVVILFVFIAADFLLSRLNGSIADMFGNHYLAITSGVILLLLASVRINYFHYDDSYEILHIKSKSLFELGNGFNGNKRYDFPKRKVVDFEIRERWVYRTLILHLENYASETKKIRSVDMTFIPKEEVVKINASLKKITTKNKNLGNAQLG